MVHVDILANQMRSRGEEIQYLEKEIELNQADIRTQEEEERQGGEQLKNTEASLAALQDKEQKLKEQEQALEGELQKQREEESRLAPLLTESKVAWATQSNEMASREREEQKLKESISTNTQQIEQYRQELQLLENRIVEQCTAQQQESEHLKQLHQEYQRKEVEVQASLADRQSLLQNIENKSVMLHNLRQQVEALKQDIHNTLLEQRSFELQRQGMEQRLKEDFQHTFEEVREEYMSIAVNDEEVGRLKRRLESMGAVNLAAPEEYANLEERYNFLLTQQQDLTKAKEDLLQVITKINQNTLENFKKTFDQVRENFRNIYHQLFEGGVADLQLTDENNLLETGVDIMAQPPGKKLQNIALLSGGEKALTAIALLFAFFMVRPSPFCILDEVDAPLDEANIGRYINMVKTFSAHSQFLIITHNKKTMAMADILYGVTMEELGVSKIISMRMQKEDFAASA
jgi:chromosome segregation protein